jgi:pimeloyl-ACP methyl ester carboxylesterase
VLETHDVRQNVALGYWDQVMNTDSAELQAWIDTKASGINCPCLAVFGGPATPGERARLTGLADAQIEEWPGDDHFVHLVDPQRLATRLQSFVDDCDQMSRTRR